jgi:hypothetical protein
VATGRAIRAGGYDGYDFDVALLGAAIGGASLEAIAVGATRSRHDYGYPRARTCIQTVLGPHAGLCESARALLESFRDKTGDRFWEKPL